MSQCFDELYFSVSNWGSELDETLLYHNGNEKPKGFGEKLLFTVLTMKQLTCSFFCVTSCLVAGHIGIAVPDVNAACKFFEKQGVKFHKKRASGEFGNTTVRVSN